MNEQAITKILENGLLGALLVLSLFCIVSLYKEAKKERDDRLNDMKQVWSEDIKFKTELKNMMDTILDLLRRGGGK